jgi:[ribosomal protein S18]-alanine N-acetyltransferase
VHVRPVAAADLPACLELFEAVCEEGRWLATEPPVDRPEVRARWDALLSTGDGTLLLAEETAGGPPIGLVALVGRARPELGILVAAGWRRRGVGGRLICAALAWAEAAGAPEVVLHVFPHNAAGLALYGRHGFESRGTVLRAYPRRSGERWDAIRMVKALGGRAPAPGEG